jgi:hypothetical protein
MIRWLIRWLSRKEIAQTQSEAVALVTQALKLPVAIDQMQLALAHARGFAEGQLVGRQEMWDHMSTIVGERTGGAQDVVTPEDLARARRGLLH